MKMEIIEKNPIGFAHVTSVDAPIRTRQDALIIVSDVNNPELD